jgi:alpha-beta hydrolase superfamily lysophospholipase
MGSLLIRTYITKYHDHLKGVILSGTSGESGFMVKMGKMVSKLLASIKGKEAPCKLLDNMSFGKFNQAFKPNRTQFDWLSRDEAEVDKYINDPYCGAVFSTQFFNDMVSGVDYNNQQENIAKISKELPIYLIAGSLDPVGANGEGVKKVFSDYQKAGIKDVEIKIYPEARHEILNETNKLEVYEDILNWIFIRL